MIIASLAPSDQREFSAVTTSTKKKKEMHQRPNFLAPTQIPQPLFSY
jgi:hypothetical protein